MTGRRKTPERAIGDLRPEAFRLGREMKSRDLAFLAAKLGPHAFAIVGVVVSANWTAVQGVNPYLAYGFAGWGMFLYMILALRGGYK
jgi:hypothetical protein